MIPPHDTGQFVPPVAMNLEPYSLAKQQLKMDSPEYAPTRRALLTFIWTATASQNVAIIWKDVKST
uniref:Uncharacterized protein n=1 Tax=Oryza nivara TaxID=4536 RepID=A0A0E0HSK3_ORYNI